MKLFVFDIGHLGPQNINDWDKGLCVALAHVFQ